MEMTKEHGDNLRKLADGLRKETPRTFDMKHYVYGKSLYFRNYFNIQSIMELNECGTVACAIGQATAIVAPKYVGESFNQYARRIFGVESLVSRDWGNSRSFPVDV